MPERITKDDILRQNPCIDEQALERLRQSIAKVRSERILATRKAGPLPLSRPRVRKDPGEPPAPHVAHSTRHS